MQKLIFLFLCVFVAQKIDAQQNLPVIKANSAKVDIRIGDEYFAKAGWTLEPSRKPDVFSIGSKWLYETKRVTFITDIDSISFTVKPAGKYNFIILLNEKTPCYIQIATLANPVFMNLKVLIPVLFSYAFILLVFYFYRNKIKTTDLLKLGYAVTIFFWLMTFISDFIHGNYNHLTNTISELGAIGTRSEIFTSASLAIVSIFCTLFSIGFYRASKANNLSVIPAVLYFTMPVTMLWAAIFTFGNEFHSLTGPLPFLVITGSLAAYLLWKKNKNFSKLRTVSLLSFFIMALILLKLMPPFGNNYEGLIQRFFYFGWTVWTIGISYHFTKSLKNLQRS